MTIRLITVAIALALASLSSADAVAKGKSSSATKSSAGSHLVKGYTKKSGTYVAPHRARNPTKRSK